MEEKRNSRKQQWKKKISIGMSVILLCGCSSQNTPISPSISLTPTPAADAGISLQQGLREAGFLDRMNKAFYDFSHDYQLEITDSAWVFTDALNSGDIVVNLITSEITFAFPEVTIEYKKKDRILKTAALTAQLNMTLNDVNFSWQSEVITEDHQRFSIQFDPQTVEIQDAEQGSKTMGAKMNFAPSLYGQCLSYFKRYWNQSLIQQNLIEQMLEAVDQIESGMSWNELTLNEGRPLDRSVPLLEPGSIAPELTLEVEMNFNDSDSLYLSEINKLQRTLYLFTAIDESFENPVLIDWDALAPTLMSVSRVYGCDVKYCKNREGQVRFADFAIPEGYGALVTQPDMNQSAKVLTGQDFIFDDYDNKMLKSGAVYSQSANSYITFSREGDWMPASPGVIVLDQKQSGNQIEVEFITYVPQWKNTELIVEGVTVDVGEEWNIANAKIIETVKDNIDRMPHWIAKLEDTGDSQFYRLLEATRK